MDIILRRIDEDLKLLYDGIKINTVNGEFYLHGAVVAVCGDTHCECIFDEIQANVNEKSSPDGHWMDTLGSVLK